MSLSKAEITRLLFNSAVGKSLEEPRDWPMLYDELRQLARVKFRSERVNHTLQPTALVHEAYLRLAEDLHFENRAHFLGVMCRLMRQVLIDHARRHLSAKRGSGDHNLQLNEEIATSRDDLYGMIELEIVLRRLEGIHPRLANLFEYRFILGFTAEEVAEATGLSKTTVNAELQLARSWLKREMVTGR